MYRTIDRSFLKDFDRMLHEVSDGSEKEIWRQLLVSLIFVGLYKDEYSFPQTVFSLMRISAFETLAYYTDRDSISAATLCKVPIIKIYYPFLQY